MIRSLRAQQQKLFFEVLSDQELEQKLNPDCKHCGFYGYVGNREAVEFAMDLASAAFRSVVESDGIHYGKKCDRLCPCRIALFGPKSVGKTTFARCFRNTVQLPMAECDATQISRLEELVELISQTLRDHKPAIPLVPTKISGSLRYFVVPPMLLFIDEIGAAKRTFQEAMLKMTEPNDGILRTTTSVLDCTEVGILIATTDPGNLVDPLKSRFTPIRLNRHNQDEIALIVRGAHMDWSEEDCFRIARMHSTSRQALQFCKHVVNSCERRRISVSEGIGVVAKQLKLDEDGMSEMALEVLKALSDAGSSGLSRKAICAQVGIAEPEFLNDVLPFLVGNNKRPPLIRVSNKHYITDFGVDELRTRGIEV